jgi:hypothetical protein
MHSLLGEELDAVEPSVSGRRCVAVPQLKYAAKDLPSLSTLHLHQGYPVYD